MAADAAIDSDSRSSNFITEKIDILGAEGLAKMTMSSNAVKNVPLRRNRSPRADMYPT